MPLLQEPSVTLEGVKIHAHSLADLDPDVTIRVESKNLGGAP